VSCCFGSRGLHLVALVELACRSRTLAHRVGAVCCRWLFPSVAVRWPSPLPPRPSPVTGWVLGVFPLGRGPQNESADRVLLDFGLSFSALPLRWAVGPSSSGSVRCASPPTSARASTPGSPRGFPSVGPQPRGRSRSVSAVSHRPDGLLRSCFAGLFHPAAGPRFTVFQPSSSLSEGERSSSRRGSYPSKNAPHQ